MDTDEHRKNGAVPRGRSWILLLVLLVTTSTAPVSAAPGEVSASDALAAKERANDLRSELESLDERGEADVDGDVLATVDREIEKGRLAVDSGEYEEAKNHFDRATEQARAELTRSYVEGAETLLSGTDGYLSSLREQGYTTAEIGVLRERITKQRERLDAAADLDASRDAYDDARSIRADAADLPPTGVVRAVGLLTSVWALLLAVLLLLTVAVGLYVRTNGSGSDGPQLH